MHNLGVVRVHRHNYDFCAASQTKHDVNKMLHKADLQLSLVTRKPVFAGFATR